MHSRVWVQLQQGQPRGVSRSVAQPAHHAAQRLTSEVSHPAASLTLLSGATFCLGKLVDVNFIPAHHVMAATAQVCWASVTLGALYFAPASLDQSLALPAVVPLPVEKKGLSVVVLTLDHICALLPSMIQLCLVPGSRAKKAVKERQV